MAIKIDLLPVYVKLKRTLHRTIAGSIVTFALIGAGLALVLQQRKLELQTAEENLAAAQAVAEKATAAKSRASAAAAEAAPLVGAVSFMAGSAKTGPQRAALVDLIRRNIDADAVVSSIDISDGQKVVINATVRNPNEYARFLLNLRRSSDVNGGTLFKGLPVAAGPKGFGKGAELFQMPTSTGETIEIRYPVTVVAEGTLLNPVQLPADPTGAAPATAVEPGMEGFEGDPGAAAAPPA
ncbi:MAG: hypothetical protein KY445_03920 [Armatimonadetes bacterium]|nr:hypothetical protein [Armatimonadota bacterium]